MNQLTKYYSNSNVVKIEPIPKNVCSRENGERPDLNPNFPATPNTGNGSLVSGGDMANGNRYVSNGNRNVSNGNGTVSNGNGGSSLFGTAMVLVDEYKEMVRLNFSLVEAVHEHKDRQISDLIDVHEREKKVMEEKHSAAIVELKRKFCNDIFELETDLEQKKYEIRQLKLQEESDIEFFQNKVDSTIKKRLNKVSKKKICCWSKNLRPKEIQNQNYGARNH